MLQHISATHPVFTALPSVFPRAFTDVTCSYVIGYRLYNLDGRHPAARRLEPNEGGEHHDPEGDRAAADPVFPGSADFPGSGEPRGGSG